MPTIVRETIYDTQIARLFVPGGDGWDWMLSVGQEQMMHTLMQTPVRSGELRRSFNLALTPHGRNNVRYTVGTYSEYADYVIFGTTGPIFADDYVFTADQDPDDYDYPRMRIRPAPHSWFGDYTYRLWVNGQTANNFMERAAAIIIAKYA